MSSDDKIDYIATKKRCLKHVNLCIRKNNPKLLNNNIFTNKVRTLKSDANKINIYDILELGYNSYNEVILKLYFKISKYFYIYKDIQKLYDIIDAIFIDNNRNIECKVVVIKYLKNKKSKLYKDIELNIVYNNPMIETISLKFYYLYLYNKYNNIDKFNNNTISFTNISKHPILKKLLEMAKRLNFYSKYNLSSNQGKLQIFSIYYALFFKKTIPLKRYFDLRIKTMKDENYFNDGEIFDIVKLIAADSITRLFLTHKMMNIISKFMDIVLNSSNSITYFIRNEKKFLQNLLINNNKSMLEIYLFNKFIDMNVFNTCEFTSDTV